MSILDFSKLYCKNSYITSILVKKKFVDDPKDTANIFNIFLPNLGKASCRKGNLAKVNHSPSFYVRVNCAEYIYICIYIYIYIYIFFFCARSLVLWFEHCGMTELLPHAWDTRGGLIGLPSS